MATPKIHKGLPDSELIAHCLGPDAEFVGGTENLGRKVVRIGDDAVIKFGFWVKRFEFENLKIAKSLVDPNIVYIPDAYRYFEDDEDKSDPLFGPYGYILMEYVRGTKIDPIDDPKLVQRVADVVAHLSSIKGETPGTLSRGPCGSILFRDNFELIPNNLQELEDFLNKRIFSHNIPSKITLEGSELVLCHLDIAPRNILWKNDGSICFLDWDSAGYFPRCFEFAARSYLLGFEGNFDQMLLDTMKPPLSEAEKVISRGVQVARGNAERYSFRSPSRTPSPRPRLRPCSGPPPQPPPPESVMMNSKDVSELPEFILVDPQPWVPHIPVAGCPPARFCIP
ncbi:hypothetical protein FQN54_001743 [Arachnomyces sp. PD_36]|nr:hypothetical protein FQN54_001743 [Arachnomyces sp. PD_36]